MAKNQLIKINSIDVTGSRQTTVIEDTIEDQTDRVVINFSSNVLDTLDIETFHSVEIWENYTGTLEVDANKVFKGVVSKIEKEPSKIIVTAFGELWKAVQSEVNKTYDKNIDPSAGVGSEIFKDLCDLSGLSYTSGTIISTGAVILLDKFVCNKAECFERMRTLAMIYGYQIWYDSTTGYVHFEPEGYTSNANTIYAGGVNNNVQVLPRWKEDGTKLFNKVELIGAYQEVQKTELFTGDASETEFTLTQVPEITRVVVAGTEQIGGTEGATVTYDYTVDKDQKKIIFTVASTPPAGADNIEVRYSYRSPRPVVLTNPTSITDIGRIIKQRFTFNDIQSVDDAETRARNLLDVYSIPFVTTTLKLTPAQQQTMNIKAGQRVTVVDDRLGYNREMLVRKINLNYPTSDVQITVGDKEVRVGDLENDAQIRLKRLEEELAKTGDFIVEVIDAYNDVNARSRYIEIEKRTLSGNNGFILGHPTFGILGTSVLGDDWGSFSFNFAKQNNNLYTEDFRDDDFKSASTTATWNTSNRELTFTSGQIGQSVSIDYNNGTITRAKMTVTASSGTFLYKLSADGGSHWETVTSGSTHFFTNTGTDLRWQITENAASTGTITEIKVEDYH